ncbi:hypothetical protein BB561_002343 [Smittium simulii]|uniref:Alkyl transferase n=1 Tax=Smittium simulii TaxID=133385 RepID=A0A2T9YQS5_9FUNG|nr:hypothetical protein BB561_002343 [Smittium simulii]
MLEMFPFNKLAGLCSGLFNYFQLLFAEFFVLVLLQGPIPKHIGFIMDGNRRFARMKKCEIKDGHIAGFNGLKTVLEWCLKLKIETVTVYAFSIDNFNRPRPEVEALMELAKLRITELAENSHYVKQHNIRIQLIGKLDLLPEDVKIAMEKVNEKTKNNTGPLLNICFPYLSSQEISNATLKVSQLCQNRNLELDSVTVQDIENNLYTNKSPQLELLIRTSGESRLSNFLLWQAAKGCIFSSVCVYWPQISFYTLFNSIMHFQIYKLFNSV